jgi:tetratricopeptide (TPR) repeat protein
VLRHLGRPEDALEILAAVHRKTDPLDVRSMAERWLAAKTVDSGIVLAETMNEHPATATETAAEYLNAGLWRDGTEVLLQSVNAAKDKSRIQPLVYYYLGYFAEQLEQPEKAAEYYALAAKMPSEYVFPFQYEVIDVLHHAMRANPKDALAPYYLGNLVFDGQPGEAVRLWEASAAIDPSYPIVHRNLAIAYGNGRPAASVEKAIAQLEAAISLTPKYALHFTELDELYESAGVAPETRLTIFEKNQDVVNQRDDSAAHYVGLLISLGRYDEAIQRLAGRQFSVREGANINVADNWIDAHVMRGRKYLAAGRNREALADFMAALKIPANLPSEGIDTTIRNPEVNYWIGTAYQSLGDSDQANAHWQKSANFEATLARRGQSETGELSESDLQSYYQALALRKLGQTSTAEKLIENLANAANRSLERSAPKSDDIQTMEARRSERRRLATAHYAAGLGYLATGEKSKAKREFTKALEVGPDRAGARSELENLN